MKKQRSASYPPHTINYALGFTEKVYKNFGQYRSKREDIAAALELGVGTLNDRISASVQYGFLDVKNREGYRVTDLFMKCYRPIDVDGKIQALNEAFRNPKLYSTLIDDFEGDVLPPTRPLANILLHNHNISESACEKAARIFEENAEDLGYLKEGRKFFISNTIIIDEVTEEVEEFEQEDLENISHVPPPPPPPTTPKVPEPPKYNQNESPFNGNSNQKPIPHNIPLRNKLPAQLLLPSDVSSADFDFIISYIGLIRNQYS